jgi:hypothetical protein
MRDWGSVQDSGSGHRGFTLAGWDKKYRLQGSVLHDNRRWGNRRRPYICRPC